MANYLLLRNNKESGPYSLDSLIELGLKPYDLIWVQGKSAAWRYPSEIDELKPIAPATEEQPFDRFFKKTEEKVEVTVVEQPIKKPEFVTIQKTAPVDIKPEYEKYVPKKSVAVTMPGQTNGSNPIVKKEVPREPVKLPVREAVIQPTISVSENPAAAQIKYSQPLDEIKEMYVKTLYERKQKIARKGFWLQSLKKAAVLVGLIGAGLIAGFVLKSNGNKEKQIVQQSILPATEPSKPTEIAEVSQVPAPLEDTTPVIKTEHKTLRPPTGGYVNINAAQENKTAPENKATVPARNDNRTIIDHKKEPVSSMQEPTTAINFVKQGVDVNDNTGERSRKVRTKNSETERSVQPLPERTNDKVSYPGDNLSRMVKVRSNEYKRVAFGGIRDLQLTVTNDSKYVLDDVTVELQYIRPNELPLKTENIRFTSVAPGGESTIRVPDTNRGIKVAFRIIHIKSRQMDEVGVVNN